MIVLLQEVKETIQASLMGYERRLSDGLASCRSDSKPGSMGANPLGLGNESKVSVVKLVRAFGGCLGTKRR